MLVVVLGSIVADLSESSKLRISTPAVLPEAEHGSKYQLQFAAEGGQEPLSWQAKGGDRCREIDGLKETAHKADLPDGLSFDVSSGLLSGSLGEPSTAVEYYCIEVTVNSFLSAEETAKGYFSIMGLARNTLPEPILRIYDIPDTIVDTEFEYDVRPYSAHGETILEIYDSFIMGDDGSRVADLLAKNNHGVLSWTTSIPEGRIVVELGVSDRYTKKESIQLISRIKKPDIPYPELQWGFTELPPAERLRPYRFELVAKGGWPPYAWTIDGLPRDFELGKDNGNPVVQGIAKTASGTHDLRISVQDRLGDRQEGVFELEIGNFRKEVEPLRIGTKPTDLPEKFFVAESSSVPLKVFGGEEPISWSVRSSHRSSISQNEVERDGTLRFTPTEPLSEKLIIEAVDVNGDRASAAFDVETEFKPISIEGVESAQLEVGKKKAFEYLVRDGVPPFQFRLTSMGANIDIKESYRSVELVVFGEEDYFYDGKLIVIDKADQRAEIQLRYNTVDEKGPVLGGLDGTDADSEGPNSEDTQSGLEFRLRYEDVPIGCKFAEYIVCKLWPASTGTTYTATLFDRDEATGLSEVEVHPDSELPTGLELVERDGRWQLKGRPKDKGTHSFQLRLTYEDQRFLRMKFQMEVKGWWERFWSLFF